jgi:hypothetical protein
MHPHLAMAIVRARQEDLRRSAAGDARIYAASEPPVVQRIPHPGLWRVPIARAVHFLAGNRRWRHWSADGPS